MDSSSDDEQYGDSPVILEINTTEVSTEVGNFSLSPFLSVTDEGNNDVYANLILSQELSDISLEGHLFESKEKIESETTEHESINTNGSMSETQSDVDILVTFHSEKKEQEEELSVISYKDQGVDPNPISDFDKSVFDNMSKAVLDLENQAASRVIKAREDALAILLLDQQCRELTTQLYTIQQQRIADNVISERFDKEKIELEKKARFLKSEAERVGY